MKKALAKIQKTEINTYIDEFVKARQKYFTDGQEWLEAKVTDEKIYVQIDRKQLEEELDDMIKISLQFGRVLPLEMKIQVRKVAGGAEISYMDNGAGSWRCQVTHEGSDMEVYQVGKIIKERFPVLESYDMTLEASVTKMMWALGQTRDMEKFKELFYTTINHDLLFL